MATWAARRSLSPTVSSSIAVASFSLTIGRAPSSRSCSRALRALRYEFAPLEV
jgi:hypothetical protein